MTDRATRRELDSIRGRLDQLERVTTKLPLRTGVSSGRYHFLGYLDDKPAIPTASGRYEFHWNSVAEGGTGDGQTWHTTNKQDDWFPTMFTTEENGTP